MQEVSKVICVRDMNYSPDPGVHNIQYSGIYLIALKPLKFPLTNQAGKFIAQTTQILMQQEEMT